MTDVSSQGPEQGDDREVLTNRQGHPVHDNQNTRTVGDRGPATLENYQFLEKISHFDRERIPERVVHARGAVAFGYFEATGTRGATSPSPATRERGSSRRPASAPTSRSASPPATPRRTSSTPSSAATSPSGSCACS
ncbi:catalase [Clavibacter michiganensis]|uniref:catalase n=1 Tax=Clavibacter michiganensis TaxID=28447 RepID=UPI000ABA8F92|nr:catalase [Clavibacter michiganensis]